MSAGLEACNMANNYISTFRLQFYGAFSGYVAREKTDRGNHNRRESLPTEELVVVKAQ